jgi:hypothetical protein
VADITDAVAALKVHDLPTAQSILAQVLKADPGNAEAWYLLSYAVDQPDRVIFCLKKCLEFNPDHIAAANRLRGLTTPIASAALVKTLPGQVQVQAQTQAAQLTPAAKPWIFSTEAKLITFLFMLPLWAVIEIADPHEMPIAKIAALFVLIGYIFLCGWIGFSALM